MDWYGFSVSFGILGAPSWFARRPLRPGDMAQPQHIHILRQLADAARKLRMPHLCCQLRERHEDEVAGREQWVRHDEIRCLDDLFAVEQNVDVDGTRRPALRRPAADVVLDALRVPK